MKLPILTKRDIEHLVDEAEKQQIGSGDELSCDFAGNNPDSEPAIRFYSPWMHRSQSSSHPWKRSRNNAGE